MEIKKIEDKKIWEDFILGCRQKTFLQSWNWGEVASGMGNKILRLGFYDHQGLAGVSLVIQIKAKRGSFLFVPHGPIIRQQKKNDKERVLKILLEGLKKIAREEKASFIRIAPILERNEENNEIFKKLGFRAAPIHIHPELTWELDITPSEEELLKEMRKTTRYLIKKGLRNHEIEVMKSNDVRDIGKFNSLYQKTKKRQRFTPFSLTYLENEFRAFCSDNQISIFSGKYLNELAASGIFIFWQNIGFYHHGASSLEYPKIPVSYLIMWEAIKEAKERGCQKFNFWGIAPATKFGIHSAAFKEHPWAGLSLFKMGFGGKTKEYVKTQDFILSKKYWPTFVVEKLRKIKRGL